jgi:hypothetical protein
MNESRDFSKFLLFAKGVIETGWVIKNSNRVLNYEAKMHFNRLLNDATQFEKFVHREMGPQMSSYEDEINSAVIGLVWKVFDLEAADREQFIDYINEFEDQLPKLDADKRRQRFRNENFNSKT